MNIEHIETQLHSTSEKLHRVGQMLKNTHIDLLTIAETQAGTLAEIYAKLEALDFIPEDVQESLVIFSDSIKELNELADNLHLIQAIALKPEQ